MDLEEQQRKLHKDIAELAMKRKDKQHKLKLLEREENAAKGLKVETKQQLQAKMRNRDRSGDTEDRQEGDDRTMKRRVVTTKSGARHVLELKPSDRRDRDRDRESDRKDRNERDKDRKSSRPSSSSSSSSNTNTTKESSATASTTEGQPELVSAVVVTSTEESTTETGTGVAKKHIPKVLVDEKIQKRNKRFLGGLLGHLARAKDQLNTESDKLKKKAELEEKAKAKAEEERQNVREITLKQVNERKQKEKQEEAEILKKQQQAYRELLAVNLALLEKQLSNFIPTKTLPTIYYVPKSHNDKTQKLLEAQAKLVEDRVKDPHSLIVKDDQEEGDTKMEAGAAASNPSSKEGESSSSSSVVGMAVEEQEEGKTTEKSTSSSVATGEADHNTTIQDDS